MMVKRTLINSLVPTPCFKNTAKGGKRIFNIIVNTDIIVSFLICLKYRLKTKKHLSQTNLVLAYIKHEVKPKARMRESLQVTAEYLKLWIHRLIKKCHL